MERKEKLEQEYLHYLAEIEGEDFVDEVIFDLNEQIRLL